VAALLIVMALVVWLHRVISVICVALAENAMSRAQLIATATVAEATRKVTVKVVMAAMVTARQVHAIFSQALVIQMTMIVLVAGGA